MKFLVKRCASVVDPFLENSVSVARNARVSGVKDFCGRGEQWEGKCTSNAHRLFVE